MIFLPAVRAPGLPVLFATNLAFPSMMERRNGLTFLLFLGTLLLLCFLDSSFLSCRGFWGVFRILVRLLRAKPAIPHLGWFSPVMVAHHNVSLKIPQNTWRNHWSFMGSHSVLEEFFRTNWDIFKCRDSCDTYNVSMVRGAPSLNVFPSRKSRGDTLKSYQCSKQEARGLTRAVTAPKTNERGLLGQRGRTASRTSV